MPKISVFLKRTIVERAKGCCEYCQSQAKFATQSFSIEHIKPQSKGGETNLDNLALACQGCNNHKYNKTEAYDNLTNKIKSLYNPRQQNWHEHFNWNEDFTLIIGLTATGRVTIETLRLNRLNRQELVNLRRVLYAMNEHLP
ncbi:HNH endonuclease signature motif containing protein [Candidatus Parabeggiatoa sp. HSG14]|uniref:HNH endonuclease n=1 Tax=Candidatus Parabeggiatoa sp. HSG14 TaxID=3055593 RepID=UPI0025A7E35F|nr:HNH endonuclease signature motif containing protein [Thiotrichales bacterium HSG14]